MKNVVYFIIIAIIIIIIFFAFNFNNKNSYLGDEIIEYEIIFHSTWTSDTHPEDYPSNPHFSPMVAVTHDSSLFKSGTLASEGIKNMAETGSTSKLLEEIQILIDSDKAFDVNTGNVIFLSSETSTKPLKIKAFGTHSKITIVSMIAPSPDWFIAVEDIELPEDEISVFPKAYDAGTDSGITFNSKDEETVPRENIHLINEEPLGQNPKPLGYFSIKRL